MSYPEEATTVATQRSGVMANQLVEQAKFEAVSDCIRQIEEMTKRLHQLRESLNPDRPQIAGPYAERTR